MISSTSSSESGFNLIELMVALAISVLLALGVAPLWIGLQRSSLDGFDRLLDAGRFQVVAARFERDLRLAVPASDTRWMGSLLLQADEHQVTLVTRAMDGVGLEVVSWEVAGNSLMRRRRPYDPTVVTEPIPGSFIDNKTMVEGLDTGSLHFESGRGAIAPGAAAPTLGRVERIKLELSFKNDRGGGSSAFVAEGGVGG